MSMSLKARTALGSAMAVIGGLITVLSPIMGWHSIPRPWGFLLGFAAGLLIGIGTALAISGLVEYRRKG